MIYELQVIVGGMNFVFVFIISGLLDGDFFEIINFGFVSMDVSCLGIECYYVGGSESIVLLREIILVLGEVVMIYFGDGIDDLVNVYFNVVGVVNLMLGDDVVYVLSYSGIVLDVVVLGNFNFVGLGMFVIVSSIDWNG